MYGDALLALDPTAACKIFTKGMDYSFFVPEFNLNIIFPCSIICCMFFYSGAVFTTEARSQLIRIMTDNAPAYRQGQLDFWKDVSELMEESGFYYDSTDCHDEFKELEAKYKSVEVLRSKTGAANRELISTWPHFKEMQEFAVGDVAVRPSITVASGSSSGVTSSDANVSDFGNGKARFNPLKKPISKGKQRGLALSVIAELKRSNDLKQRFLEKQEDL